MLPRPSEHYRQKGYDPYDISSMLGGESVGPILKKLANDPLSQEFVPVEARQQAVLAVQSSYGQNISPLLQQVREITDQFVSSRRQWFEYQETDPLFFFDSLLAMLAFTIANTENGCYSEIIKMSLGDIFLQKYVQIASSLTRANDTNEFRDYSQREITLASIVFRNIASFGLWRSLELAKESRGAMREDEKPRAFVGAIALDMFGHVLETGYRGEPGYHRSVHAEDVLLRKLERRQRDEIPFLVAASLEPCKTRSPKHHACLGHGKGCSQLLHDAGVPIIAYLLTDTNRNGNGSGSQHFAENGTIVFSADDSRAILIAQQMQVLQHLQHVTV